MKVRLTAVEIAGAAEREGFDVHGWPD